MAYAALGSYILFKEVISDELGHLYRAGELGRDSVARTVWLRVLDGPGVPAADVVAQLGTARRVSEVLQAANVASGVAVSEVKGVPLVASDYMAAQPLDLVFRKAAEEGFPVPVDNALLVLEKLSLGLAAAMTVEIGGSSLVHGCLHPGLVLVSTDGEAQIVGFGFADQLLGLLDIGEAAASLAPYLAPEVLVTRTASKRGDVYSLGAILFELLTGTKLPAEPEQRQGILDRAELSYDERPIPDDIKTLLARALAPRPEERFSSAADFKKELDKLLYGGNYSPTTFNLALFMDRLFRGEIEAEERERMAEAAVDVTPYLQPEPEPEPEPVAGEPGPARGGGRGPLIGIAVAAVVVAIVAVVMMNRTPPAPAIPPTPTAEEVAAQRQAEDERLQAMVQQLVQQQMEEKEREIRTELEDRQSRIDELQKQLRESQKRSAAGQVSDTERQQQAELQRQIAAAEQEQRRQQEALEAERQRLLEESRKQVEAQRAATATAVAAAAAEQQLAAKAATPTPPPAAPTEVAEAAAKPPATAVAAAAPPAAAPTQVVTENQYIEATQVDSQPVVLKEAPIEWSRPALRSRSRGMVIVRALVRADGTVENVEVLRADDEGMNIPQSVVAAVREYRFKPATKNGVNVKTWATVTTRYWFRDR